MNLLGKFMATALTALSTASAGATPIIGNASVDDVTLGGRNSTALAFSDANPASGSNGDTSGFASAFESYGTSDWRLLGKIEQLQQNSAQLVVGDLVFNFSKIVNGDTSGAWSVQNTSATALNLDLAFAMHASNSSTAFLFDNQIINASQVLTGTWNIEWLNNGGRVPGFSNLVFFNRNGSLALPPVTENVPEPGSLALTGLGLLGLGVLRRRRKRPLH